MRLFNKKIKTILQQNRAIQSKVIYNTKFNVIILVQYYDSNLYSAMQFLNNTNKVGLTTLIAHYAETKEEDKESNNETGKIKINTPIEYINHKYYMLVSGTPKQYAELYKYLELSNPLLESITLELYNNVSSTQFEEIINTGVLREDEFKYCRCDAKYDSLRPISSKIKDSKIYYDDFTLIMGRIPSIFESINVMNIIHVHDTEQNLANGIYRNPVEIVREMEDASHHYDDHAGQETYCLNHNLIKELSPLYNSIAPELINTNDIDTLYTLIAPIYMIEEYEDDVLLTGSVSPEKLDEIFQQEYDRFNNPASDANVIYVNVDEEVNGLKEPIRNFIPTEDGSANGNE